VPDHLRQHLLDTRLAGRVATSAGNSRGNVDRLLAGEEKYTFGLSDWRDASGVEVRAAVEEVCGAGALDGPADEGAWIDPDATLAGIGHHRERLAEHARAASRVLIATGHPTGLLPHAAEVARTLAGAGCELTTPLADVVLRRLDHEHRAVRYLAGVGCVWTGGDLIHSHLPDYMEALLDAAADAGRLPDLVVADHGMAGAAIERGIETLAIADVNDPALPLAQARARTAGVLPIDDNLAPAVFDPVTAAVLAGVG
jgi:hypothetical protein